MTPKTALITGALVGASLMNAGHAAETLTLDRAVAIATGADDPAVVRFDETARALADRAVADSQLADPTLNLTLRSLPVDTFDFTQEQMTQAQIGLRQAFPAGDTLKFRRRKRTAQAGIARAGRQLEITNIVLETRLAWLDLYDRLRARETLLGSRGAVAELAEIITAGFATGRSNSQHVLRAELELSLIDDRLIENDRRTRVARAQLARYVATAAARDLPESLPELPQPSAPAAIRDDFVRHPAIGVEDARVAANSSEIAIAQEQYKPSWALDLGYGFRAGGRADFATVGVSIQLPLFPGKRQDRRVSAARHERNAAWLERDRRLLEFDRMLGTGFADWQKLGERIALYERAVLQRAASTSEAALAAYGAGLSDFDELIRSRLAELDAQLTLLRLRVDRAAAQARLLYLDREK